MKHVARFCFALVMLVLAGCAVIQPPNGGDKDVKAPHVVRYEPDSAARNFSGQKISIQFDEYVQLNDVQNQLIISPPLNEQPDVQVRQKKVVITFHEPLRSNSTYTINFGNAVRDIAEGNIKDNFRYVFSTGPEIDTLRAGGKVVNAFTNAPQKGVLVMLYDQLSDSVPYKQRPFYFAKTKDDGSFSMTNLHPGTYKIFALTDADADYKFSNAEENIAFSETNLELNGNNDTIKLRMFREERNDNQLKKITQPFPGKIVFEFNRPVPSLKAEGLDVMPATARFRSEWNTRVDSMTFWLHNYEPDTLRLQLSENNLPFDTAEVRVAKPDKKTKSKAGSTVRNLFQLSTNTVRENKLGVRDQLMVISTTPVEKLDMEKIILRRGKKIIPFKATLDPVNKRTITFNMPFEEDSAYSLIIPAGTMTDFFDLKNDTLKQSFVVRRYSEYGSVKLTLDNITAGKNYILQLLDDKGTMLKEETITGDKQLQFDLLLPGSYSLRLIDDVNKNGKWDTGNYLGHLQPESVYYYSAPMKIRAGWDMEVTWKLK